MGSKGPYVGFREVGYRCSDEGYRGPPSGIHGFIYRFSVTVPKLDPGVSKLRSRGLHGESWMTLDEEVKLRAKFPHHNKDKVEKPCLLQNANLKTQTSLKILKIFDAKT